MNISPLLKGLFGRITKPSNIERNAAPNSCVLLLSEPYAQTKELYEMAASRAFGIPYDGSDPMYFVYPSPDFFFVKAGTFLISIQPHHGAYLAVSGEYDTATGAALLHSDEIAWWHQQRAWVAFDMQNKEVTEQEALPVLAKLLLPLLDTRCCGVWMLSKQEFLPNDGRALQALERLSLG